MKIEFKDATIADVIMTVTILGGYVALIDYMNWSIALLISLITGVLVHDIFFIAKLKLNNKKYKNKGE